MDSKDSHSSGCFRKSASPIDDDESISASRSYGAGISMDSYMQSFHHSKGIMMNGMSPQPPPPVAMSLRARESSAMALKQIFEYQINNSGASSREQANQGQQMGGFQGTRNPSMPDLRKRLPELDLTFRKSQDNNPPYAQTGFGSPISTPTATSQSLLSQSSLPSRPGPMNGQFMQQNYLPQAAASTRPNPPSRQSTAQMTIFYSGNVNVYDDVPADKAHAIMLLAGNSWSSNFRCPALPAAPVSHPAEMTTMKERAPSPVKPASSQQSPVTITSTNVGGIARSFSSPVLATPVTAASLASPPPSPAPAPVADNIKLTQAGAAPKRPHAGIELPHARKASLARFLEKRKDRVQVQVNPDQQEGAVVGEKGGGAAKGGESASCSGKPDDYPTSTSASSKKQCMRSRSPSPSRSTSKVNNSATNVIDVDVESTMRHAPMMNEHRFFG